MDHSNILMQLICREQGKRQKIRLTDLASNVPNLVDRIEGLMYLKVDDDLQSDVEKILIALVNLTCPCSDFVRITLSQILDILILEDNPNLADCGKELKEVLERYHFTQSDKNCTCRYTIGTFFKLQDQLNDSPSL